MIDLMEGSSRIFPCFDAHSDILTDVTIRRQRGEHGIIAQRHLPKLAAGGVEGSLFVVWVDSPEMHGYAQRWEQILACARDELAELIYTDAARVVRVGADIDRAREDGRFYIMLGIEGMGAAGGDPGKIEEYYDLGFCHGMLTWNEANAFAAGAMSGSSEGLSKAGEDVVRRMQRLGMLVDVSHLNDEGFRDVVRITSMPIVATHSNCRALCSSPRNLTDDQLLAIRSTGGVVGLNSLGAFISDDEEGRNVEGLVKHALHMIDVMGIDHVGCGFDFCGFLDEVGVPSAMGPDAHVLKGMKDSSEVQNFFYCLEREGLTPEDIEKIARGNFIRVIKNVLA